MTLRGFIFLLWLFIGGFALYHHEMWRDELLAWDMAVAADGWQDWLANIRYDPHPKLWHFLLFLLSRVSEDLRAVQLLHFAIAAGSAWMVLKFAPFAEADRALLPFGYFFLYEYAAICRSYAPAVLFLTAFCCTRRRQGVTPWILLSLAALTGIHALILACALALFYLARAREEGMPLSKSGAALFLASIALSVFQAMPPADSVEGAVFGLQASGDRVVRVLASAWKGLVPVPAWKTSFWNSNALDGFIRLQAVLGLAALAGGAWLMRGRRPLIAAWVSGAGALMAFAYVAHLGYARHAGFLFLLLVWSLWLRGGTAPAWPFRALLVAHVAAAAVALAQDARLPFSGSRATAEFIRASGLGEIPIVGHGSHAAAAVGQRLGRAIYFADSGRAGRRVADNFAQPPGTDDDIVADGVTRLRERAPGDLLLVLNFAPARAPEGASEIFALTGTIVRSEGYRLYRVARDAGKTE